MKTDDAADSRPPARKRKWPRRVAKGLLCVFVAIVLLCIAGAYYIDHRGIARPPALPGRPQILTEKIVEDNGIRRIGDNWIAKRDGLMCMSLTGDPFTLGYANGTLTEPYLREQEQMLLDTINSKLGADWKLWLLKKYVTWRNRDLPDYIPAEYQLEVLGLAMGGPTAPPAFGPTYHVVLNCHAAHDISHMVMGHPLVGCTAFAAWGAHTQDGHLVLGRNFDWNAGACFDRNKIVTRVTPDTGIGFVSISWPGMAGVVSGINDELIAITVNAAQSAGQPEIGTPVSILIRDVLQHATSLNEAVRMIQDSHVFVADSYLVADGKIQQAVIVEKTPQASAVRRPDSEMIVCANHFLADPLCQDAANQAYINEGTSVVRYERMEHLVQEARGELTVERAARILRDRHVPGIDEPVVGHASAINNLQATHSVVIDVTDGIVWVAAYPHQLGAFVPFQLEDFATAPAAPAIPPDPTLLDGTYERYAQAQAKLSEARELRASGEPLAARGLLLEAAALNPLHYEPRMLLGQIALDLGKRAEAREELQRALDLQPAHASERAILERLLVEAKRQADAGS